MAIRVELERDYLKRALDQAASSANRAAKGAVNKLVKELHEKDAAIYTNAANTLTDIK